LPRIERAAATSSRTATKEASAISPPPGEQSATTIVESSVRETRVLPHVFVLENVEKPRAT
jgi:hypothetical protein